jgi:hypothetical protein
MDEEIVLEWAGGKVSALLRWFLHQKDMSEFPDALALAGEAARIFINSSTVFYDTDSTINDRPPVQWVDDTSGVNFTTGIRFYATNVTNATGTAW